MQLRGTPRQGLGCDALGLGSGLGLRYGLGDRQGLQLRELASQRLGLLLGALGLMARAAGSIWVAEPGSVPKRESEMRLLTSARKAGEAGVSVALLDALEELSEEERAAKSHHQNALALCALCAALYSYTRETGDNALVANLRDEEIGSDTSRVDVPVILNGKREAIWFTGTQALDLKTVRGAAGAARDDSPEEEA